MTELIGIQTNNQNRAPLRWILKPFLDLIRWGNIPKVDHSKVTQDVIIRGSRSTHFLTETHEDGSRVTHIFHFRLDHRDEKNSSIKYASIHRD